MKAECAGPPLQGTENLTKRHKVAAACFNLSLLLRTLFGVGTPKQWMAGAFSLLKALIAYLLRQIWRFRTLCPEVGHFVSHFHKLLRISTAA